MMMVLIAGALGIALAQQQQQTDTTFDVRATGRLEVDVANGSVTIATWDRAAMRVRATRSGNARVEIDRDDTTVTIDTESRRGLPGPVRLEITVPRRYSVQVEGMNLPITIDGVQGTVELENVEGAITVRGSTGPVDVESVSGSITLENIRGNVAASSVNQAVRLNAVRGDISAETVNGAIIMRGIDAARVEANTVNGLVEYSGAVHDGGHYYLGTHNGRITMAIPEQTSARLLIATHNGKVEAAFPVQIRGTEDREFSVVLGNGSARIELESFNGSVYLVRPGGR